jgi:RNA polymerase sigma-70 factor (ECF subfamily)
MGTAVSSANMTPRPANTAVVIALQPIREERIPAATAGSAADGVVAPAAPDVLASLLARVAMGDRNAFRATFELVRGRVFGLCLRMLRNRAEAEEALQDVFVRIWQHAAGFRGDTTRAMPWVLAIARNRCLEMLRRRGVDDGEWSDDLEASLRDETPTPEERVLQAAASHSIVECMRALEPPQRQAIELAFYDGLSYSEAALRLARPEGTVKSQIRRALLRLKRCLRES